MSDVIFMRLEQAQALAERLVGLVSTLSDRVKVLEANGGQANMVERILVNGILQQPDEDKSVDLAVPTRVNELENDAGFQENVIEKICQNGNELAVTAKSVDIHTPETLSELINDLDFQNGSEVREAIAAAIAQSGHASFVKADAVPAAEDAEENILYLVLNDATGHYDIYAKVGESMELLDDTTVDLSGYAEKSELEDYVAKEEGKALSANDYTDEDKAKLDGVEANANCYVLDKGKVVEALGYTPGNAEAMTVLWDNVEGKPETFPPDLSAPWAGAGENTDYTASKSMLATSYDNNTWYNVLSIRHRNGQGDGNKYGLLLFSKLTEAGETLWYRKQCTNWTDNRNILDSSNYGNYAAAKNHTHDLSAMINTLTTGTSAPVDADYYVCQWAGGGTTYTSYHRRPMSALWTYIKGKTDSTYAAKSHSHNYAGSGSAGGTANSTNGFTFGVQSSDPGANSSLTTNKILLVYK